MTEKTNTDNDIDYDIDYEHMDDLPLSDHIEWNHLQAKKTATDDDEDYNQID